MSAFILLMGVLALAWGYLGDVKALFYVGLGLVVLGVIPSLVFGILGNEVGSPPSRHDGQN